MHAGARLKSDCFMSAGVSSDTMALTDATSLSLSDASKPETKQGICNVFSPWSSRLLLKGDIPLPLQLRHFPASSHPH